MTYANQQTWQDLQQCLPEKYRFTADFMPSEEWWDWQGHRIHLDTFRNANAPAKVILFHGVGTNGRQLSLILGGQLAKAGYEVIATDMPTYGMTKVKPNHTVIYDDWINAGDAYINHELAKDDRPIFLYGLSAGGMLTYDVAAQNRKVKGIIGMTFLDQSDKNVRNGTCHDPIVANIGVPLMPLAVKLGLGKVKMKMSLASKMSALCNDKQAMKIFSQDKTSAGNSATFAFLHSYMHHIPANPSEFDVCPVLLTQPMADKWTPLEMSLPFLNRIQKVPVQIVKLDNGGHYPVEPIALEQMNQAILGFLQKHQ